jgi:hypothetical protein
MLRLVRGPRNHPILPKARSSSRVACGKNAKFWDSPFPGIAELNEGFTKATGAVPFPARPMRRHSLVW